MTGPLADLDYSLSALFAVGAVLVVIATVIISAFLPRREGPSAGKGGVGALLVWGALLSTLALVVALSMTARFLPITVVVVLAGFAVLGAPFLVEPIPRAFRETRSALTLLMIAVAGSILALPVIWTI